MGSPLSVNVPGRGLGRSKIMASASALVASISEALKVGRFFNASGGAAGTGCTVNLGANDTTTVQNAINAAVDGDVICMPSGSVTWATPITITDKRITLQGPTCTLSGTAVSAACPLTITGNVGNQPLIQVNSCDAADFVTLAHFTYKVNSVGASAGSINVSCGAQTGYPPEVFRIHHVQCNGDPVDGTTNNNGARCVFLNAAYGLIDHSQFFTQTDHGMVAISAGRDNNSATSNTYHHPFSLGDRNAVYIEDSFSYSTTAGQGNGATDNYTGARIVWRMNTTYNNNVGLHGWDSQPRGVPTFEFYGNTFIAESGVGSMVLTQPRSGTGIVALNVVRNLPGTTGYVGYFGPIYYGAMTPADQSGNPWLNTRASGAYPSGTWGTNPISGVSTAYDNKGNRVTGSNPIDGNQFGAGSMDADYTRTVTDLSTTSGSAVITSVNANFVAGDLSKRIYGTNIKAGRIIANGGWSLSGTTLTCASCNFTIGDVGRLIGNSGNAQSIPTNTTITSVTNTTTAVVSTSFTSSSEGLLLIDCYLVSINEASNQATMNCKADGNGTNGTLTIGYTNEGYPLADQPGRGYFATANAGNWPNSSSYTDANYEALMPIYLFGTRFQNQAGTWSNPPTSAVSMNGVQGYVKANREWYDPVGELQTNSTTPFNGTVGTGIGTLANRPTTCTAGVGYWAVDQGSWNAGSFTYTYPNGGSTYSQGQLYKCTAANTWTLYWTPLTYPHPLQTS